MTDIGNEGALYGALGVVASLVFANFGAAYGTAKSGLGICSIGIKKSEYIFKAMFPVIIAGVLGIYGLILSVILSSQLSKGHIVLAQGYKMLASGLVCGLSSLCAGIAIGIVGDAGIRALAEQNRVFIGMIIILIFAEALGLYGLIVGLLLLQ